MDNAITKILRLQFEITSLLIASKKRNAILNIRVNKDDIEKIKKLAKRFGVGYQTLISELIHRTARNS